MKTRAAIGGRRRSPSRVVGLALVLSLLFGGIAFAGESPFTSVVVTPNPVYDGETAEVAINDIWADGCPPGFERVSVDPNTEQHTFFVEIAGGPPPGQFCPAVETPYTLTLPLPLPRQDVTAAETISVLVLARSLQGGGQFDLGSATFERLPGPRPVLPLEGGRFLATVEWNDLNGRTGSGKVVPGRSRTSGAFWFFRPDNWELLLKVINGCGVNGRLWVLGAAATNVGYTIRIEDTVGFGPPWIRAQAAGRRSRMFVDTQAFTCDVPAARAPGGP